MRRQRSTTRSPRGWAQQTSTFPAAGSVDGLGLVGHVTGHEARLAGVAHARPARPADRDATRLGQLEHRAVAIVPARRQPAAGERHRRPRSRRAVREPRGPVGPADDAGGDGAQRAEGLGADVVGSNPSAPNAAVRSAMKRRRTAEVHVGVGGNASRSTTSAVTRPGRDARLVEPVGPPTASCSRSTSGRRAAAPAGRGPRRRRRARTRCGRRGPTTPDGSSASAARAWSMASTGVTPTPADTSATGPAPGAEREGAARRGRLDRLPGAAPVVDVAAGDAVRLALDADAVARRARRPRERVVAHDGRARIDDQPDGQVLPRQRRREGAAVGSGQPQRRHGAGLPIDAGDRQRAKARPRRRRAAGGGGQAGVATGRRPATRPARAGRAARPSIPGSGHRPEGPAPAPHGGDRGRYRRASTSATVTRFGPATPP